MKKPFKILLVVCLLFAVERLVRTQTNGFRIEKTRSDYAYTPNWEVEEEQETPSVLQQPFTFLDSGVQCYAFLSEDKTTVLKLFKHYHAGLSSKQLRRLPLPEFLNKQRNSILHKRQKRMNYIFSSALLAQNALQQQTGVYHLNINPQTDKYPTVTIYDKIGIRYDIDLNTTPFVLQKKADLIFSYLESHPDQTSNVIDSLFYCIQHRNELGIANSDPVINSNFGVTDGRVVEIDVGSFFHNPYIKNSLYSKREIFYETLEFKEWLKDHAPEMNDYFEEKLLQAIRT